MQKAVIVRNAKNEHLFELSNDKLDELNNSFSKLVQYSKNKWAFKIIQLNFDTLIQTTDSIFKELTLSFPDTPWQQLEIALIEFNRYFLNYLSSLNTFLDQQFKFLSKEFGEDSKQFKQFKNKTSEHFDNHLAYRLLYKLRNYTVHCGFSILGIEASQDIIKNGNKVNKRISYAPYFLRKELLDNFNFGAILKPELEQMDENIMVFDLVHKSISLYEELDKLVQNLIETDRKNHAEKVRSILNLQKYNEEELHLLVVEEKSTRIANIPYHYLK